MKPIKPLIRMLHRNRRQYQLQLEQYYATYPDMVVMDDILFYLSRDQLADKLWLSKSYITKIIEKKKLPASLKSKIIYIFNQYKHGQDNRLT